MCREAVQAYPLSSRAVVCRGVVWCGLPQCTFADRSNTGLRSYVSGVVGRSGEPRLMQVDEFALQLQMPFTENVLMVKVNDAPGAIAGNESMAVGNVCYCGAM